LVAASKVLLIHSDTVVLLAFAAAVIRFSKSGLKRTGTMRALAVPFAIFGRPTFLALGWLKVSKLLYDGGTYSQHSRCDQMAVKNRNVSPWILWVVGIVRPCVNSVCMRMPVQLKNLYDPFPNCLPLKTLFDGNAFDVRSIHAV
jgi:hypothetical protein